MAAPHHTSHATLNPTPEPPPVSAAMARAHQKYWRFNLALIATLMTLGFVVSFVLPLVAPALDPVRFIGFRLPFYFGAQGAILIYVALIVVYIVLMQRADRRLQRAFDTDASSGADASTRADSTVPTARGS
jgi:putative solute:sodium symporter small subunit